MSHNDVSDSSLYMPTLLISSPFIPQVINTQVIHTLFRDFVVNTLQDLGDTLESRHLLSKVDGMELKALDPKFAGACQELKVPLCQSRLTPCHDFTDAKDAHYAFGVRGLSLRQFYEQDPITKEISLPIRAFSRSGRGQRMGGAGDVEKEWQDLARQQQAPKVLLDGEVRPLPVHVCFPRTVSSRFTPDNATRTQLGLMTQWRQNRSVGRSGRTENSISAHTRKLYGTSPLVALSNTL